MDTNNSEFNTFWANYPRRQAKKDALRAWSKIKPPISDVLKALEWQKRSKQWLDGFIPLPATYINGERWNDEPAKPVISAASHVTFKPEPERPPIKPDDIERANKLKDVLRR